MEYVTCENVPFAQYHHPRKRDSTRSRLLLLLVQQGLWIPQVGGVAPSTQHSQFAVDTMPRVGTIDDAAQNAKGINEKLVSSGGEKVKYILYMHEL